MGISGQNTRGRRFRDGRRRSMAGAPGAGRAEGEGRHGRHRAGRGGGIPAALGQETDAAIGYAATSRAASTRLIYDADWRRFQTWCAACGVPPLPADPVAVAQFCATEAEAGRAPSTITRRLAAIGWAHKRAGHTPPQRADGAWAIAEVMAGIRRSRAAPRRKRPRPMPMCYATCCAPAPVRNCAPCGRARCSLSVSPAPSGARNRYSVPASFANRPVSVRVYPDRIVVAAEGQVVCEHPRVIERSHHLPGRTVYDWRHYLAVIQRKPGALRNGAPFADLPEAFRRLQGHLLKRPGGDREMVEILALVLQHDEEAVLCAVELALEAALPTKTHILNLLHRLVDAKAPATAIDAPNALSLRQEPQANVQRYDALRTAAARREADHAA